MNINEYILKAFSPLLGKSNFTKISSNSFVITLGNKHFVDLTKEEIQLANKINLLSKIQSSTKTTEILDVSKVKTFLQALDDKFIRLNHVGISYFCDDPKQEIEKYKRELEGTGLKLYQEQSESKDEKWFFIGNISNWETPLCEIVLNSATTDWYKEWLPAFQVDIDTTFTMEELEVLAKKYFGKGFWKWKLDIPNYGVVLAMAILGEINGTKITFGVGTNLRDTKYHRNAIKEQA